MRHRQHRPRVGVIGAGPGGLAAAMLLRRAGAEVVVHERLPEVGGRSRSLVAQSEAGAFRFDMGPTFFLYPRVLQDVFATCGMDMGDWVDLLRVEPQYRLVFETGGQIDASADPARLAAEIARFSPQDAAGLPRFMADNRRKLAAFRPVLERPFNSVLDLLRPDVLGAVPKLRLGRTVDDDLRRYFSDARVRLAFSFQSKYLGMSPFRCPSMFTILAFMEYEYGVWHPRGGCGAVMQAMARAATLLGAAIRLDEPVEEILFDGRRAVGLRAGGLDHRYDALVLNADFAHAMRHLVPDALRRRWSDARIGRKTFSCSTFMLYLGIEGTLPGVAHHTIYLAEDYRGNVRAIEDARAPPERPSFYVQNAGVTDSSLAPPGHSGIYVLVPVGNNSGGIDWAARAPAYRELVLDRLAETGFGDLRPRIRAEIMLTPDGWENDMAIHRGATFNLSHSLGQMLHMRPRNRFEDLGGVYLVGGGTHPGSGLPVIFESARISARLLAEDLGLDACWDTAMAPAMAAQ